MKVKTMKQKLRSKDNELRLQEREGTGKIQSTGIRETDSMQKLIVAQLVEKITCR
jgi:hypothetical protein